MCPEWRLALGLPSMCLLYCFANFIIHLPQIIPWSSCSFLALVFVQPKSFVLNHNLVPRHVLIRPLQISQKPWRHRRLVHVYASWTIRNKTLLRYADVSCKQNAHGGIDSVGTPEKTPLLQPGMKNPQQPPTGSGGGGGGLRAVLESSISSNTRGIEWNDITGQTILLPPDWGSVGLDVHDSKPSSCHDQEPLGFVSAEEGVHQNEPQSSDFHDPAQPDTCNYSIWNDVGIHDREISSTVPGWYIRLQCLTPLRFS